MFKRFPKLNSPYVREYKNNRELYTVTDEIKPEYEWVFNNKNVEAIEKLDGENVAIYINEKGKINSIYTREGTEIKPFGFKNRSYIVQGVLESYKRGWLDNMEHTQLHYGELIGPSVKQNPYDLDKHMWVPFEYLRKKISYESWGEYPQDFESISNWFKNGLKPLFYLRIHNIPFHEEPKNAYVEGIIFNHPDGRKAKLRRNMFNWYYGGDENE